MCYQPTPAEGLIVGGGYYVLDRLADPTEIVTFICAVGEEDEIAVVRGARGAEFAVACEHLSPVPAAVVYRQLLTGVRK